MDPNNFTAIDFETATSYRNSICQVGLVRVENFLVTQQLSLLVQPPNNYYWNRFTDIHGIAATNTVTAPTFDVVWQQIAHFIAGNNVVAHNGFAFDFPVLAKTLELYKLPKPDFTEHCTYKIYKTNLADLCKEHKIKLNHHDALSDAKACAELFVRHLQKG